MKEKSTSDRLWGTAWPFAAPELLDDFQRMTGAWMRRRQDAMEHGFRGVQALCACRDPAAFAAAYGDWLAGSMNLALAELNEMRADTMRWMELGQSCVAAPFRAGSAPARAASRAEAARDRAAAD